jgi:hypothetical protein
MSQHIVNVDTQQTCRSLSGGQVFRIRLEEKDKAESRWIEELKKQQKQREKELAERERQREQQQQEQPSQKTN